MTPIDNGTVRRALAVALGLALLAAATEPASATIYALAM